MIDRITAIYTRRYRDSGQVTTYVEWTDKRGTSGRTEGGMYNEHMQELIRRGEREGIIPTREDW